MGRNRGKERRSDNGTQKDLIGLTTSNLTWASYLYATVGAGGALTTGVMTVPPIYQQGGTPATANKEFTFSIGEMRGYLGNGSTAPQAYAVFMKEAVTSTTAHGYNGVYDSAFAATLPALATYTSKRPNLRVSPDFGYAVGDQFQNAFGNDPRLVVASMLVFTPNTIGLQTASNITFQGRPLEGLVMNKSRKARGACTREWKSFPRLAAGSSPWTSRRFE